MSDTSLSALHSVMLHCLTLHSLTLHFVTLYCLTLHCLTRHCLTLQCLTLEFPTLHCLTLHYLTLHCLTLHCLTLHCLTLHWCLTLHCVTPAKPDIYHFFYTHTFSGLKILHTKARKFETKIASRQNSENQHWEVKFTYIFDFFVKFKVLVKLQRMYKTTPTVYNYTLCVKLYVVSLCVKSYFVCNDTLFCVKLHLMCKITHFM